MVNKNKENDSERDLSDKKRRKSIPSNSGESSSSKISKEDIYTSVVKFVEQESRQRTAEKDSELFHETCNDLRGLFAQIADLKKDNTEKAKQEINEKRIEGSFLFVILKKLNRLDKVRVRFGRDTLHKEKLSVDSNRLQLQNLLYEAEHLRKEVQRCFQFKSQDEEIDLVSEVEFYEKAPQNIARPDKTEADEHARRLARLEWELQQRKELAAMCKELHAAKEKVADDIESKTNRLDSLAPRLDALLKATRPLQEVLDMDIEKEWEVQKIARLLPRPLYLVYANLSAYSEACDNFLTTTIHGDEEEAKQLEDSDKDSKDDLDDNTQDSDNDDNNEENERSSKSHHHRRQSKSTLKEIKKTNLFKPHPLNVLFKISTATNKASLCVTLHYMPALNFVTAQCKLSDFENIGVAAGEVVAPNNILNCLNPDDYGEESSNPKTIYQLQELSIDPKELITLLNEKELGRPYKWAQQLCGLEFVNYYSGISHDLVQSSVPDIIKQIRSRWQARLGLYKQIYTLENKNIENLKTTDDPSSFRVSNNLVQWTSISWAEYRLSTVVHKFIEENFVTSHDLLYRAVIARGTAKLECFICISANFPAEIPLWSIQISWNGIHTAQNNSAIREMESWVNSVEVKRKSSTALGTQLKRAMSCLDIYLETEGTLINSAEFTPDKTFLKAFRGRTRSRPFKIIKNSGSVVYTQI